MNYSTMTKTLLLCTALAVGAAAQAKNNGNGGNGNGSQGNGVANGNQGNGNSGQGNGNGSQGNGNNGQANGNGSQNNGVGNGSQNNGSQNNGSGNQNNGNVPQLDSGPTVGKASVDDVKLEKVSSDSFAFSTANPMQHGGNTAGFASAFASAGTGTWSVLGTVPGTGKLEDSSSLFDFSFTGVGATSGTWSITNTSKTQDAVLDLTVAIHAANASTAFLFNNEYVGARQTLTGTWQVEWLNHGGEVPAFSNLVFFGRDVSTTDVTLLPVPEPETLPMVLAGFAVLGAAAWRRRASRGGNTVA